MPLAPVVMLPQVPLPFFQPPASAKPAPWVPLASQASYGVALPPQSLKALSALDERGSFLFEKQVCSQLPSSLSACVLLRPYFPLSAAGLEALRFSNRPRSIRGVLHNLSGAFRPPQVAWQQEGCKGQQHGLLEIQEWPCC